MCGYVGYFGNSPQNKVSNTMIRGIFERGEVTETFSGENINAVVRRLKIVDRDHAVQPFVSPNKQYVLIYNGEIFNYKKLRDSHLQDYVFTTESDTETLLALLITYKKDAIKLLNGQFSFVFFDLKEKSYFAARDHIGISPLYYCHSAEGIYFSSTVKGLTSIKNPILSLSPGEILTEKGIEVYFSSTQNILDKDMKTVISEVRSKITEAVLTRVDTDLPIGVIYSGGIDSSIVLDLAVKNHSDVTAFTIGKEGSEDFEISQRFCKERNISQVIIPLTSKDLSSNAIKEAIKATELTEYLDIINAVLTMSLFREINKRGIKVTLSGDGSDELFGGYDMYNQIDEKNEKELFEYKLKHLNRTELQRVDRAAGRYRIENRVPFLDINVIEIALSLKKEWKIRNGVEKWCVRKAFEIDLPEYILYRRKNPLSHSSGLHEAIRFKQLVFKKYYNSYHFDLHDEIRRDFSITLAKNSYNMDEATKREQIYMDYSLLHKLSEFIKGFIRYYIFSPNFRKRKKCISGNV